MNVKYSINAEQLHHNICPHCLLCFCEQLQQSIAMHCCILATQYLHLEGKTWHNNIFVLDALKNLKMTTGISMIQYEQKDCHNVKTIRQH